MSRSTRARTILGLVAFSIGSAGGVGVGQDVFEVDMAAPNSFLLAEATFRSWIFPNLNRNLSPREYFEATLGNRVDDVTRSCSLLEGQRRKLILAGRGDIKRFFERVEEVHDLYERLKHDQRSINQIQAEATPLAAVFATGLHGEGSLFAKTLDSTLDPDQAARLRESILERARFRYKAKITLAVARLDDAVGFTSEQARRLIAVILEETTPIEKPIGPNEATLINYKIAKIPESKLRPIFDDDRWKRLRKQLEPALAFERFLRRNQLIEDTDSKIGH